MTSTHGVAAEKSTRQIKQPTSDRPNKLVTGIGTQSTGEAAMRCKNNNNIQFTSETYRLGH